MDIRIVVDFASVVIQCCYSMLLFNASAVYSAQF